MFKLQLKLPLSTFYSRPLAAERTVSSRHQKLAGHVIVVIGVGET